VYGNNNPLMFVDPSGMRGDKVDADVPVVDTAPDALALVAAVKKPAPECGDNRKPPTKRNPTPACVRGVQTAVLPVPLGFGKWLTKRSNGAGRVLLVNNEAGERRAIRSDGGCSAPTGDTGRSFNFRNACKTHDLGYDLMRFFDTSGPSGQIRKDVDNLSFRDLKVHCGSRATLIKPTCAAWERTYYQTVAANSRRQGYDVP
jgi:Prokaryotic phospholipase A2